MNELLAWVLIAPAAYLVGSIPVGIIVSRFWGGVDPREHGSGSMGTTNVLRTVGKKAAALVLILDFAKGVFAVGLPLILVPEAHLLQGLTGTLVMVGHMWPVFAGLKGGKGIATGWAVVIVLSPYAGGITFIGMIIALTTRYVSLGSMIGAALGVGTLIVLSIIGIEPVQYLVFAIPAVALVLFSHRENMMRLLKGTENRLDINAAEGPSASGGQGA